MPADNRSPSADLVPWGIRLCVAAVALGMALLLPRGWILHKSPLAHWPTMNPLRDFLRLCVATCLDAGFVAGLATAFLILLILFRRKKQPVRLIYGVFLFVNSLCVAIGFVHVRVMALLGRPFNYQWLYYSSFLRSIEAHESLLVSLQWKVVTAILIGPLAYLVASIYLGKRIEARIRALHIPDWAFISAILLALLTWSTVGYARANGHGWTYASLANPVYEFTRSWVTAQRQPKLFTMKTTESQEEFAPARHTDSVSATPSIIKNVVLFVLESTPAEYLGMYGSTIGVTPTFDHWAKRAAVFQNIYAHAPASNKSLFSILCSTYPWISYESETEEKPDISLPSIVSVLQKHGYATGFFSSGDLKFQRGREFLSARGFGHLEDYTQRKNTRVIYRSEKWPFLNGSDETSTAQSLAAWFVDQHRAGRPVFGMLWTDTTHYPYFTESVLHRFGPDENLLNRYLNALHSTDTAFATLMESLEKAGIVDETLVVVVGDHGEAFGRHNQFGHANAIYEENCHVPLMLINSRLFNGQRYATVGGLIDIAPTIMALIGVLPATEWQGRSLFSTSRSNRTYFFAPWSDYLFGYRDGDLKFLYNASRGTYEIYDLSRDPEERVNAIANRREQIKPGMSRLARWVQYQDRLFRGLIDR